MYEDNNSKGEKKMKEEHAAIHRFSLFVLVTIVSAMLFAGAAGAQEYPLLDMIANKVITKYQQSSCEQLWQKKGQPESEREKEVIQMLQNDPQMRQIFLNKVAAPIANKMFECGLLP